MSWENVRELLSGTTLQPGTTATLPSGVPSDYAEFLRHANGAEGFVGAEQYLMLWSAEAIAELNESYAVATYAPGVLLLGTDGSDTGYGVRADGTYVSVPLVGMSLDQVKVIGRSLEELLRSLAET